MANQVKSKRKSDTGNAQELGGQSAASARTADNVNREYHLDAPASARAHAAGLLLRARDLLLREIDTILGKFGTSNARFQVLAIICRAPNGTQIGEVAARASVHPTTMTSTIDRLRRDGLIKRRKIPSDRRAILVIATPRGHEVYEQARDALGAFEFGLSKVDLVTVNILRESLDRVAVALEISVTNPEPS